MLRVSEESFINHNFAILGLVDHYKCNLVISSSRIRMISVLAELLFGQKQTEIGRRLPESDGDET